jgi:hypothetical protein
MFFSGGGGDEEYFFSQIKGAKIVSVWLRIGRWEKYLDLKCGKRKVEEIS